MSPARRRSSADLIDIGERAVIKITVATVVVIFIMLLLVYRSITTVILLLAMVGDHWRRPGESSHFSATSGY